MQYLDKMSQLTLFLSREPWLYGIDLYEILSNLFVIMVLNSNSSRTVASLQLLQTAASCSQWQSLHHFLFYVSSQLSNQKPMTHCNFFSCKFVTLVFCHYILVFINHLGCCINYQMPDKSKHLSNLNMQYFLSTSKSFLPLKQRRKRLDSSIKKSQNV